MILTDDELRDLLASDRTETARELEEVLPEPGYRRWSLWRSTARFLARTAVEAGAHNALEFGSGRSSLVLARALALNGGGRLTALENLPEYSSRIWPQVQSETGVDALLIGADLKLHADRHGVRYEYEVDPEVLERRGPFDLVFIDAPPFFYGREGTLPSVIPYLAPGALVVLDDTRRVAEQRMVERWVWAVRGLHQRLMAPEFGGERGHGVAVLEFDGDARRRTGTRLVLGSALEMARTFRHPRWKLKALLGRLEA